MHFLRYALIIGLFGLLAGCSKTETGKAKVYRIAVIPKGTTHEFWKAIHAGAKKAEKELNAKGIPTEIIWQGPLKEDDRDQQIQVVENFTTRQVDGIVLAPLDSQALVRPVETAGEAEIPVVIIDSGLNTTNYVSFVATDNYEGGNMAGKYLGKLMGGKGKALLLRYAVGSASTEKREQGFLDALKKGYPDIELVSSEQHAGPTRETAYQASQNLLNRYGQEINGVFAVNENSTIGMTMALRDIGKVGGKIVNLGFDAGSQSVEDLKKGDVQGLVVRNPMRMGYLGVMTVMEHIQGKKVEKRIDTGVMMVTPGNFANEEIQDLLYPPVDEYLK